MSNRFKGNKKSNVPIFLALTGFAVAFFFGTCYWVSKNSSAIDPNKPLPASAQYRGAYVRAGWLFFLPVFPTSELI